jgi:peptide/nickel transport system substrate-binding protein
MKKKNLLALLLALAMTMSLASCGGGSTSSDGSQSDSTSESPAAEESSAAEESAASGEEEKTATPVNTSEAVYGGSATFYYPKLYTYFDAAAKNQGGYMLWNDNLFMIDYYNEDYTFESSYLTMDMITGQLADSWVIADDYSSIDITLKDGIYFQDKSTVGMADYDIYGGREMTADDVVYSISRLLGINDVAMVECETDWSGELYMVDGVEAVDAKTVRINLNTSTEIAMTDLFKQLVTGVMICGPEWDELTADQQVDWHYAAGTGAYYLTDYVADNYMTFVKNDNYFDVDPDGNQLPYLDEITLLYIAEGDQILTQFISGNLDWFGGQKSGLLTSSQIAQLKATMSEDSYSEYLYPSSSPSGIGLNEQDEIFSNLNVRLAMQHAINCEEIWTKYYGYDTELVIPGLWQSDLGDYVWQRSDEVAADYTYDPELAKELLAEAGYPDGFTFEIVCDPLTDMDLYELVKSYLSAVGITMNITPVSEVMEHNSIVTDESDTRAYNSFAGSFSDSSSVWGMTVTGGFGSGLFHYNDEYDQAYENLTAATDMESAAQYAQQMDEIFSTQHWIITFGGVPSCSEFISSRLGGYTGAEIYNNSQMHTILARLWATDAQ